MAKKICLANLSIVLGLFIFSPVYGQLCEKKSGQVFSRDQCKTNEVPVQGSQSGKMQIVDANGKLLGDWVPVPAGTHPYSAVTVSFRDSYVTASFNDAGFYAFSYFYYTSNDCSGVGYRALGPDYKVASNVQPVAYSSKNGDLLVWNGVGMVSGELSTGSFKYLGGDCVSSSDTLVGSFAPSSAFDVAVSFAEYSPPFRVVSK